MNDITAFFTGVGWIMLALYFLPAIIALIKGHANKIAIAFLNLVLGWTLIGWVAAFIWACASGKPAVVYVSEGAKVAELEKPRGLKWFLCDM